MKTVINKIRQAGRSITVQLMVMFLAIWIVVSILVMVAFTFLNQQLANKIMEGQKDRVSYYAAIVNADLSRITDLMQRMCVDDDVAAFLRRRDCDFDYQDYEAYLDSLERLKSYQASSMYIDDVFLVIPQTGELLRANRGVITIPEEYENKIQLCMEEEDEVFFRLTIR
ncbi:MAG: hypothetical protein IJ468_07450 [Lachnospiraceae bacterium]|nr:hypothetical protein [Lachnospiraceae bacterium]